jgi:hypothetical protein
MLAAMDEPEEDKEPEAEGDEESPKDDEPEAEDDKDESAKAIASKALASAQRAERASILATRPDLSAEAVACLKDVPVSALASALKAIPRKVASPTPPKAEAPVLGNGQGAATTGSTKPATANDELDRRMGFAAAESPIATEGNVKTYGVFASREQARQIYNKHTAGGAR